MNYLKVYNALIEKRKLNPPKENYEKHHIKPKSLFPELAKDKNNLVKLTYREHYLAHHLLYRYYKSIGDKNATSKMALAWFKMCYRNDGLKVSLSQLEKAKLAMKVRPITEDTRLKLSLSHLGQISGFKGKKHTEYSKNVNKLKHLNISSWNTGIPCKEITKEKLRNSKNCKKVLCIELNKTFKSLQEASRIMKINRGNIGTCCRKINENLSAGGFHWRFV